MSKKNMFGDYIKNQPKNEGNDNKDDEEPKPKETELSNPSETSSTKLNDTSETKNTSDDIDDSEEKINYIEPNQNRSNKLKIPFPESILPWGKKIEFTEKLLDAGYSSIKLIATATTKEIAGLTGINELMIEKLIQNAKGWEEFNFETAANLLQTRNLMKRIPTGSKSLDKLLGGGIEPRSITEFYGSYTSGKTQLSIQLSVNAVLPTELGGLGGEVVYIDTEGSFRPERIVQICGGLDYDPNIVLQKILVGRAHNTNIQMHLTNSVVGLAKDHNIKLLVIDSLTSNFRAEYIGKGSILERQQKLNQHIQQLSRISDLLNIAVVITNQVMAVMDGFETSVQAVGGNILAHGTTHRIELIKSKTKPQHRSAKLIASPSLPESRAVYKITNHGIEDIL